MSTMGAHPRKQPCASCPYRVNVPSGIWHPDEYAKLERYDGEIHEQIQNDGTRVFSCHQDGVAVCSGWLGHREEPSDLIAVRMGIIDGQLDPSCAEYTTQTALFPSGHEAAKQGRRDLEHPSNRAQKAMRKIMTVRDDLSLN